jgi:curved DNA-binding protein CbpA
MLLTLGRRIAALARLKLFKVLALVMLTLAANSWAKEWTNYYTVLGISPTATQAEAASAFRQLALRFHPDLHPGDAAAEAQFKEIAAAWDVIKNPEKRAAYDREYSTQTAYSRQSQASGQSQAGGQSQGPSQAPNQPQSPSQAPNQAQGQAQNQTHTRTQTSAEDLQFLNEVNEKSGRLNQEELTSLLDKHYSHRGLNALARMVRTHLFDGALAAQIANAAIFYAFKKFGPRQGGAFAQALLNDVQNAKNRLLAEAMESHRNANYQHWAYYQHHFDMQEQNLYYLGAVLEKAKHQAENPPSFWERVRQRCEDALMR